MINYLPVSEVVFPLGRRLNEGLRRFYLFCPAALPAAGAGDDFLAGALVRADVEGAGFAHFTLSFTGATLSSSNVTF